MPRPIVVAALAASLALSAFAALAACASPQTEREPELLVGVAASLRPVAEAFAERFEAERDATVTLVTGSSGALAEQLRQGAPLDLILSADARRIADLAADGLLAPGSVRHLATGELVAVTTLHDADEEADDVASLLRDADEEADDVASLLRGADEDADDVASLLRGADEDADDVASLLRGGRVRRIALANPELAPYGEAARRYLQDAGLWESAEPLAVYGASVAQALQYAASGAAELGFVARSLLADGAAANFPGLRALPPLPKDASDELRVALGVSATSPNAKLAGEFAAFLENPARANVWPRFGYAP